MKTAREQAREAARQRALHSDSFVADYMAEGADAASDVWEPIVRDLVDAFDPLGHTTGFDAKEWAAMNRAKEALGR